jgi:ubiquinone/menaquinone biosynthesis C-methylase UbiE
MDARLQRRVQRYGWDKATDHYEGYWSRQLLPAQSLVLEMAGLQPGERVLDVACGTGLVSLPAATAVGEEGEVVGTDLSARMVEAAGEAARSRGLSSVRFERMDAEKLALEDGAFDAALNALGLMYVPDPPAALREMKRVLRPGGRAVAAVWGARARCGWAEIFPIVDRRVESDVCPMFFQLGTAGQLERELEIAGFDDVRSVVLGTTLRYEGAEDALGAAFAGGPVALAYSRMDDDVRAEAHAEYLESIEPYRDGEGYAIPGEFVVCCGRKANSAT